MVIVKIYDDDDDGVFNHDDNDVYRNDTDDDVYGGNDV